MDKLVKLLAPFGVTGIVFIVALTSAMSAGLAGAAAFTSAMAALGPGGMIGGLITWCCRHCIKTGRRLWI